MSDSTAVTRLFVALHLPQSVATVIETVLANLSTNVPRGAVRWSRLENIHLTLRFVGNVPTADIPALQTALSKSVRTVAPFTLHLGQPGCFPNRRAPRVLWIGLEGDLAALADLHRSVQQVTSPWGEPESRDFHPHLTLGRVNSKRWSDLEAIDQAMTGLSLPTTEPWLVDEIHLMRSELRPSGAVYTSRGQFSLAS
jgi:2'-5' RNA ligase